MNRKLQMESPVRASDGSGGYTVTWQTLGVVWAEITARSGSKSVSVAAPVSAASYKIVIRAAPHGAPDRPLANQRMREGNRLFHIQAVLETDADARYLTCIATEEVSI